MLASSVMIDLIILMKFCEEYRCNRCSSTFNRNLLLFVQCEDVMKLLHCALRLLQVLDAVERRVTCTRSKPRQKLVLNI